MRRDDWPWRGHLQVTRALRKTFDREGVRTLGDVAAFLDRALAGDPPKYFGPRRTRRLRTQLDAAQAALAADEATSAGDDATPDLDPGSPTQRAATLQARLESAGIASVAATSLGAHLAVKIERLEAVFGPQTLGSLGAALRDAPDVMTGFGPRTAAKFQDAMEQALARPPAASLSLTELIEQGLASLPAVSQAVLLEAYDQGLTLHESARPRGLTRERLRQLRVRALADLQARSCADLEPHLASTLRRLDETGGCVHRDALPQIPLPRLRLALAALGRPVWVWRDEFLTRRKPAEADATLRDVGRRLHLLAGPQPVAAAAARGVFADFARWRLPDLELERLLALLDGGADSAPGEPIGAGPRAGGSGNAGAARRDSAAAPSSDPAWGRGDRVAGGNGRSAGPLREVVEDVLQAARGALHYTSVASTLRRRGIESLETTVYGALQSCREAIGLGSGEFVHMARLGLTDAQRIRLLERARQLLPEDGRPRTARWLLTRLGGPGVFGDLITPELADRVLWGLMSKLSYADSAIGCLLAKPGGEPRNLTRDFLEDLLTELGESSAAMLREEGRARGYRGQGTAFGLELAALVATGRMERTGPHRYRPRVGAQTT